MSVSPPAPQGTINCAVEQVGAWLSAEAGAASRAEVATAAAAAIKRVLNMRAPWEHYRYELKNKNQLLAAIKKAAWRFADGYKAKVVPSAHIGY